MATSKAHYEHLLSPVYSWMYGGFDAAAGRNAEFFAKLGLSPRGTGVAVDLGSGSGFQSVPLARLGYSVVAIDLDEGLLEELRAHAASLPVVTVRSDLRRFSEHVPPAIELAVCMTDTILHLESREDVSRVFADVYSVLEAGGKLILTFRDLTRELIGLDRFIPVRNDADTLFTCFLEYETETVKVHDLVYSKDADGWQFKKSYYRKLRLSASEVADQLTAAGFSAIDSSVDAGLVTIVASKRS